VRVALAGLPPTTLYAVSFPGLGQSAARAAMDAQVLRDAAAAAGGGGPVAPHPCLLSGYSEPAASADGGGSDAGSRSAAAVNLTGTGDVAGCTALVKTVLLGDSSGFKSTSLKIGRLALSADVRAAGGG
jgi:hypothetical protein